MRAVILLVGCLLTDVFAVSEVQTNYHDAIGIPTAERIKALEEAIQANRNITIEDRIIGGELVPLNAYPFFAGLLISLVGTTTVSVCSFSLLSPNRVVTAAHCNFDGVQLASEFTVVLGSNYLYIGGERIATRKVFMHPYYIPKYSRNDIAILYLPWNVKSTNVIHPIKLPDTADLRNLFVGYWATAVGFGSTSDAQKDASDVLSHVKLQVMENAECAYIYEAGLVTSGNICTSGAGRVGICSGDSGGPLIATDINGTPFLIGISSFRSKTSGCEGGKPSVFTRVTGYMDFIIYHLSHDDCAVITE